MKKIISKTSKEAPGRNLTPSEDIQVSIHPFNGEINSTDGSEFLVDAIRMKERPPDDFGVEKDES
jgi:hypothetical protein